MEFSTLHSLRRSFRLFIVATALTLAQGPLAGALQAQSSIASDGDSAAPGYPPADDGVKGWGAAGGGGATPPPAPPAASPPPPPPPPAVALAVYVAVNGTTTGPFDAAELARMVESGELTEHTLVWHEGMADWQPAGEVAALEAILAPAPVPAPEPAAEDRPANDPKPVPGWGPRKAPGDEPADADQPATGPIASDPMPVAPAEDTPAAFDPVQYLAGTWETSDSPIDVPDLGQGTLSGTYTYRADGAFELDGRLRVTVNGIPLVIGITGSGTFQAQTLSEGESFTVTPNGQMSMSVPGYPPENETLTDPTSYVVVDGNTMRDSDGITWSRRR